ncbi:MAG: hypothetical protein UY76_C0061G0011 [Candidatus Uhrbacteria bacterium GW2011_GWA2_52_8d]|uniref:Uncharacterized protein n=1 Tax=Candidatus Uhrbacteria bacterium GW2011_GWA2_52_8d TaxID=1618979 RepID=A0A0G1XK95_9BACT|nr:MAG: hypothetical protein UY76_C0061G0011 [Candidatus Uhrbacteria bacterium GW2011_GWA2_52_8d]
MVERIHGKDEVSGSIPDCGSKKLGCASSEFFVFRSFTTPRQSEIFTSRLVFPQRMCECLILQLPTWEETF